MTGSKHETINKDQPAWVATSEWKNKCTCYNQGLEQFREQNLKPENKDIFQVTLMEPGTKLEPYFKSLGTS